MDSKNEAKGYSEATVTPSKDKRQSSSVDDINVPVKNMASKNTTAKKTTSKNTTSKNDAKRPSSFVDGINNHDENMTSKNDAKRFCGGKDYMIEGLNI